MLDPIPACLRQVPIAAKDATALEMYVGDFIDIDDAAPGEALLVEPRGRPQPNLAITFWSTHAVKAVHPDLQVWVAPTYNDYRKAWESVMGKIGDFNIVLDHLHNRELALKQGIYGLLRLHPVRRGVNTSGGRGLEQSAKNYAEHQNAFGILPTNEPIDYAGAFELAKMFNIRPGAGGERAAPEGVVNLWHEMREQFQPQCFNNLKCECGA